MSRLPVLRVARPTDQLEVLSRMYVDGLDFKVLDTFEDHAGFDGVILGYPGAIYHIEFTTHRERAAEGVPSDEHLLVFYVGDTSEWSDRCDRVLGAGFVEVPAGNPYWDEHGRTFADADGYRVVICKLAWTS